MTSNNKLKIGIVGCGKMGINHLKAIQLHSNAKIVGVADQQADSLGLKSLPLQLSEIYSSTEDMLKETKPDVVHITTPPSTHAALAKLALSSGANVYVEKPFTLTRTEAEEVLRLANEKGLKVCAGHQVLFEASAKAAILSLKDIGKIVHIESYFSFRTVRRNITPVNQLIDIIPHPVYLLLQFLQVGDSLQRNSIEMKAMDIKAGGEVRALIQGADTTGILIVTLNGRPIESYLKVVGTNGSLVADFVRGIVINQPGPGASAIPILLSPYKQAGQLVWRSTKAFAGLALRNHKSYPGLAELIGAFYDSILNGTPSPITSASIIQTVGICETITTNLKEVESIAEDIAEKTLLEKESALPRLDTGKGTIMVTGGTGFLGRKAASEMRENGWPVRVITRRMPPFSLRDPGVQYVVADLADTIPMELMRDVDTVVHCAAETAGGKEAHEVNSIGTTRNILEASAKAGISKFIHISSVAVLKTGHHAGGVIDEATPVDVGNIGRGPYVWGKAESESLAVSMGKKLNICVKIIRLGPLVDFDAFEAPGRLGREIGNTYVAIGSPTSEISLCKVQTAAEVIRKYVGNFNEAPAVLNLVEPTPLTRGELTRFLLQKRPDMRVRWLPHPVLKILSIPLWLLQKIVFPKKKPVDIYAAFASEKYKTDLAAKIIDTLS